MNERIKELRTQAMVCEDGINWILDEEKFAELIVRECADAGDMAYDARCPYIGDYIGEQMGYGEEHGIANWRHEG